jgi:hypothetical protein
MIVAGSFLGLLALTLWAFAPGTGGQLIFDDIPNLMPWQDLGDINSAAKAVTFTFSGTGIPGRPLSLLSFLIDDQSWSPDIHALKRTNLAIHLINFCLVFWLCLKVFRYLRPDLGEQHGTLLALLAAGIWALHPLQVSNVSYIIQRMNLLSTTLELAGLLVFLHGREQLHEAPRKALLLCSIGIGLFMPLAVLAKENGLLLCVFALLAERFCFTPVRQRWWQLWKFTFLWLPLLAFVVYYTLINQSLAAAYAGRPFTLEQRLLTQGPVVADYLSKLLLPRLQGSGLYFDNFPVSRSLLEPATLFAWTALGGLLALAWTLRRRLPLFSFGIFFYFGGHLMESTVLPLEMYFEHRNYLPQAGLWLAVAGLLAHAPARLQKPMTAAAIVFLAFLLLLTRQNAHLWSQPELQTAMWYHDNPGSLRTSLAYADLLLRRGDFGALQQVLENTRKLHPEQLSVRVAQHYVSCYWQDLPTDFNDLPALVPGAPFETASITMLEQMRTLGNAPDIRARLRRCKPITDQQLANVYRAMVGNHRFGGARTFSRLNEFLAEIATSQGDLNATMHHYDEAFRASGDPVYPYRQAILLFDAGLIQEAAEYAARTESSVAGRHRLLHPELQGRLEELKSHLRKAMEKSHARQG